MLPLPSYVLFLFILKLFNKKICVQFCGIAKSGDHPWEDLVKFGCKLNMKVKTSKGLLYFWLPT
jgi:hypothetical protein